MESVLSTLLFGLLKSLNFTLFTFFVADEDHHHSDHDESSPSDDLQAAYKCFETTANEATRESIAKKYKRLSLLYHPDRNGNSAESVAKMQEVNHFKKLLEEELDRQDGIHPTEEEADDDHGFGFGTEASEDPNEPGISKGEKTRRKKARQKAERKRKAAFKRREEEIERERREMEREMKKEWNELKRRMSDFRKKKKSLQQRNRREQQNLVSPEGRDEAHESWMNSVQEIQEFQKQREHTEQCVNSSPNLHDIDEEEDEQLQESSSDDTVERDPDVHFEKPKNPIMDYCSDDFAIALGTGESVVARGIIEEAIGAIFSCWFLQEVRRRKPASPQEIEIDDTLCEQVVKFLLAPLDQDGNHALHYAVYFEDEEVIDYLVYEARKVGNFPKIFTSTNRRNQTVLDYCVGCDKASIIPNKVQALWDDANDTINRAKFGPTLQRFAKKLVQSTNFEPTGRTMCALFVGRYIFNWGWVMAISVGALVLSLSRRSIGLDLFASHVWFSIFRILQTFVWKWMKASYFSVKVILVVCFLSYFWESTLDGAMLLTRQMYRYHGWIASKLPSTPAKYQRYDQFIHFSVLACLAMGIRLVWRDLLSEYVLATLANMWASFSGIDHESASGSSGSSPDSILNPRERALAAFDKFMEEESDDLEL